jgi:hypothetical protein
MIDNLSVCYPRALLTTGRDCRSGLTETGDEASSPQLGDTKPGIMTSERGIEYDWS